MSQLVRWGASRRGIGSTAAAAAVIAGLVGGLAAASGPALAQSSAIQGGAMAVIEPPRGPEGCDPGERRIRFSHVVVEVGHPKGEAATALAKAVNAALDGQMCMVVYPDSTLFDDDAALEALLRGDLEMAAPSLSKFDRFTKVFRVFDLPFLFQDADAVEWFQNSGPGSRLRRSLKPTGLRALGFWNNGMKQMSARQAIRRPEDVRGMTFRIQNSDVLRAQFQMLGVKTKSMPFRDVAKALKGGAVDGQENSWSNILSKEFYRWQDGVTETNHGVLAYMVVTSDQFWGGLPRDARVTLASIVAKISAETNQRARDLDRQARERLESLGVPIRRLTKAERAAWVEAVSPVWRRFEPEIGADFIEAAESANR